MVAAGQALTGLGIDRVKPNIDRATAGAVIRGGPDLLPQPGGFSSVGGDQLSGKLLPFDNPDDVVDVQNLTKAVRVGEQLARTGEAAAAAADQFAQPTSGVLTSGYGARWGVMHYGLDIANAIGTPIYSVADGVVVESGPASGFGLWVLIRHANGYSTVYGHINQTLVTVGQRVKAGEQIAEMGNRGYSTGPHLHFEVRDGAGNKLNPQPWLAARGVTV